jgi:CDP-diacylglycerol--glycerol-3-phosphate 3-phosphatidyltransferase
VARLCYGPTELFLKDLYFSIGMYGLLLVVMAIYLVRAVLVGRARNARTDKDGGSVFVHKAAMEMGYWLLRPLVSVLVSLHVTPNAVTLFSLVPALLAAVAAGLGHFGLACVLGTASALCDLVDGVLARETGVASDAGEVMDAAVDRYVEFVLLAGIAVFYRDHWMVLTVTFLALLGSLMISYSTAKAEAISVELPRAGSMRRAERAIYLLAALGLTPITRALFASQDSAGLRELPMLVAVSFVALFTNVASVRRFAIIAAAARRPPKVEVPPLPLPPPAPETHV